MTSCVVTGAAGFIGSRLSSRLLDEGCQVTGIDGFTDSYDPGEKMSTAMSLLDRPGFTLATGHLMDLPLGKHLAGADVVFHLAARAGVRPSFSLEKKYRYDNVASTDRLVTAAREAGVRRLVYASSSSVYGEAQPPFAETRPTAPVSPYGRTKLEAEQLVLAAAGDGLEAVALRYFTVFGPGQRPDMALRLFAEAAMAGRPITLLGDGTQSRDFTYVDDIVEGTVRAATASVDGMAVNIGGGSRITLLEILALLEELLGHSVRVVTDAFAAGDVHHTCADTTRAAALLGYVPTTDFADGYAQQVAWLQSHTQLVSRRSA